MNVVLSYFSFPPASDDDDYTDPSDAVLTGVSENQMQFQT